MGKLDLIHKVTASPHRKIEEKKEIHGTVQHKCHVLTRHGKVRSPAVRAKSKQDERPRADETHFGPPVQVCGANATQARTNCQFVSRILIPLMTETTDVAGLNLSVLASPFLHLSRKT